MSKPQFARLMSDSLTVSEKWEILQPFYEASFNTAYNRVTLLSVDHLFGVKEFNEKRFTCSPTSCAKCIKPTGITLFSGIKCNIQFVINDSKTNPGESRFFQKKFHPFRLFQLDSRAKIEQLKRARNCHFSAQ